MEDSVCPRFEGKVYYKVLPRYCEIAVHDLFHLGQLKFFHLRINRWMALPSLTSRDIQ